jgi:ferredoxin
MAVYQVRLINDNIGLDQTITVAQDQYIIDVAEENGIILPSGCMKGECSCCVGKLISGKVEQNEQKFLKPPETEAGYILLCVARPLANCEIHTHQEQILYDSGLYYRKEQPQSWQN